MLRFAKCLVAHKSGKNSEYLSIRHSIESETPENSQNKAAKSKASILLHFVFISNTLLILKEINGLN